MTENGLEPGDNAISFTLPNANPKFGGDTVSLEDINEKNGIIVLFTCNHCPYVVGSKDRISFLANYASENGIGFVAINSNDAVKYPDDGWDPMIDISIRDEYSWPYLHDESQSVAASWGAERTPEVYLMNSNLKIIYRGRIDDSPKNPQAVTSKDLDNAISLMLNGEKIDIQRTQSIGCSVKWKI